MTAKVPGAAVDAKRHGWVRVPGALWALVGSLFLACIFARVALANLTRGVPGGDSDGFENVWDYFWVKKALFDLHQSIYYTNYIYYPTGTSLRFATLNPFNALLTMPFNQTIGYVPALNLLFIFALTLTCFFSCLLFRDLLGDGPASFAAAALATFANIRVVGFLQLGQGNMISGEWLPLYVLLMLRAVQGRPVWGRNGSIESRDGGHWYLYGGLAVATLVVMSLTDWQYIMFAVFVTLVYFLFLMFTTRPRREKLMALARLAGIGALFTAIVGPTLVMPMVREAAANPWLNVSYKSESHSVDLAALLSPGLNKPGLPCDRTGPLRPVGGHTPAPPGRGRGVA